MSDPFNLARFVDAQAENYADAEAELRRGRKDSHWMWYVFPQLAGLGRSDMARRYAISGREEAVAYLAHPLLGERLKTCCAVLLGIDGRTAYQVFGSPDDVKLHSCLTLFAAVSAPGSVFEQVLAKYFDGVPDEATVRLLAANEPEV